MQATALALPRANAIPRPGLKPTAVVADLPRTFQEALAQGWTIQKEESAIDIGSRRRSGVVLLRSNNAPVRLRIPYVATAKLWKFAAPVAITTE